MDIDIKDFDIKHRTFTLNNELYRFNKFIESTATDIHHVISRKERDKFFVNNDNNLLEIKRRTHVALNQLFWDRQNPKKQLEFMYHIWKSVLSPWVKQELYTLFNLSDDMFYNAELLKNGKKRK